MAGFEININKADLAEVEKLMRGVKNGYPTVVSSGINKTLTGVRTDSVKEIQKDITPKAKIIRKTFKIHKASKVKLKAAITCTGGFLPLYHYKAKQTKKGVSVKVSKRGKRTLWRGAFIATMKSGHTGVFTREKPPYKTNKSPKLPWKRFGFFAGHSYGRLPIREIFGPRIPGIMGKDEVMQPILIKAGDRLQKEIDTRLNYELSKLK